MKFLLQLALTTTFALAAIIATAQNTFEYELDMGARAYRAARYEEAVQHFQNATNLDPQKSIAHLYLATAYAQQFIPGVETADNSHLAEAAVSEYQAILKIDQHSINSLKGIAYIRLQQKRFEDAKAFYHRAIGEDQNDAEAYYSIGVIDWTQVYSRRMKEYLKIDVKPDGSLISRPECWAVRSDNESRVKDGMENLAKALELRPDYDDAIAYMNLMYRERANIECSDPESYESDMATADHWVDFTLSCKRTKAEKYNAHQPDLASSPH